MGSRLDEVFWVEFNYERLPQVCYVCGLVGHSETHCKEVEPGRGGANSSPRLGPWLRATQGGRRILESRGDHEHNAKKDEELKGGGTKMRRKVSEEVLAKFEKLTMLEKKQDEDRASKQSEESNNMNPMRSSLINKVPMTQAVVMEAVAGSSVEGHKSKGEPRNVETSVSSEEEDNREANKESSCNKVVVLGDVTNIETKHSKDTQCKWKRVPQNERRGPVKENIEGNDIDIRKRKNERDVMDIDMVQMGKRKKAHVIELVAAVVDSQPRREP